MFNQIYNEDCLEGMKRIPDGAVDFILTDLPFGITDCEWDKKIPFEPMWKEFYRVAKKNAAIALFAKGKFLIELAHSNLKDYRYKWVWEKNLACGFLNARRMPLCAHEDILIFYRKLPTYNPQFTQGGYKKYKHGRIVSNVYGEVARKKMVYESDKRFPRDVQLFDTMFSGGAKYPDGVHCIHPTEKPVALLEYFIRTYTNEGELVLDATIGSGSTAVAAINTNRQFIGFELDEKYFEIANRRIAEAREKVESVKWKVKSL